MTDVRARRPLSHLEDVTPARMTKSPRAAGRLLQSPLNTETFEQTLETASCNTFCRR